MLLEAHKPLDAIVIMLGTNDCKTVFSVTGCRYRPMAPWR